MNSTRRSFLAGSALFLIGSTAGCVGQRSPRSTPRGPGSGPSPHGTTPNRTPYGPGRMPGGSNRTPYDPDDMPYDPDDMPYDPDGMPHGPGSMPDGMPHGGTWSASDDDASLDEWFSDVDNYAGIVDRRNEREVRVAVGAPGNGGAFAFGPAAVRVSPGTRVVWEWTGDGGTHDVAAVDGTFASDYLGRAGDSFAVTATAGTHRYYCTPHRSLGMKGALVVD